MPKGRTVSIETISVHEAETHFERYLAEVERGKFYIISDGETAIAMLKPIDGANDRPHPPVGDIEGEPFEIPDSALAPLTEEELQEWGL